LRYNDQPLLNKWHALLVPILDQFIESYKGNVNKDFWNKICDRIPRGSGSPYITGWINIFVPFLNGKWIIMDDKSSYGSIYTNKVSTGYVEVPISVDNNGDKYKVILCAGAIIPCYDKESNKIRASFDYAIVRI